MKSEPEFTPLAEKVGRWVSNLLLFSLSLLPLIFFVRLSGFPLDLKCINDRYGDLITALVAGVALFLAYKEFKIRNSPVFFARIESLYREPDLALSIFVKNTFDKPIFIENVIFESTPRILPSEKIESNVLLVNSESLICCVPVNFLQTEDIYLSLSVLGRSFANNDSYSTLKLKARVSKNGGSLRVHIQSYEFLPQVK
jgi:hypothetical protein